MRTVCLLAVALTGAGCVSGPIGDLTDPPDTLGIVQQVRCEFRQAVWTTTLAAFQAKGLIEHLRPDSIETHDGVRDIQAEAKSRQIMETEEFTLYGSSSVTYAFDLDNVTLNQAMAGASFRVPLTSGLLAFGLDATTKNTRTTEQLFRVSDTFEGLITNANFVDYCNEHKRKRQERVDILTRPVGFDRVVENFVGLTWGIGRLVPLTAQENPRTYSEKLIFQTDNTLSGDPIVNAGLGPLAGGSRRWGLNAGGKHQDKRTHQVILALALPSPEDVDEKATGKPRKSAAPVRTKTTGLTEAQKRSLDAGAREINRIESVNFLEELNTRLDQLQ
ncbi:MAG: hypothetical protein AAF580_06945 [Pseudomonadota bacterium]